MQTSPPSVWLWVWKPHLYRTGTLAYFLQLRPLFGDRLNKNVVDLHPVDHHTPHLTSTLQLLPDLRIPELPPVFRHLYPFDMTDFVYKGPPLPFASYAITYSFCTVCYAASSDADIWFLHRFPPPPTLRVISSLRYVFAYYPLPCCKRAYLFFFPGRDFLDSIVLNLLLLLCAPCMFVVVFSSSPFPSCFCSQSTIWS